MVKYNSPIHRNKGVTFMSFSPGDLIKYQGHRLYILSILKHWFKEYIVCIDFTNTLEANNEHITIAILTQTSSHMFSAVEDNGLFNTLHQKSVTKLQKNSKDTINMVADASGIRSVFTEKERIIISQYLEMIVYN
ncbi:MAG: hypothetical protein ACI4RU_04545 [Acutalibacteraceae bacterium]